jgi:xanthine/uracil permease
MTPRRLAVVWVVLLLVNLISWGLILEGRATGRRQFDIGIMETGLLVFFGLPFAWILPVFGLLLLGRASSALVFFNAIVWAAAVTWLLDQIVRRYTSDEQPPRDAG